LLFGFNTDSELSCPITGSNDSSVLKVPMFSDELFFDRFINDQNSSSFPMCFF